jgi:dTDP-4-dehydrorhamnose 3,5-epimerase/reductase
MKLLPTKLKGLRLFELEDGVNGQGDYFPDNRGAYAPFWHFRKLREMGMPDMNHAQTSMSKSKRGVIRGIHGEPFEKLVYVPVGKVFVAEVDLREGSESFGRHETFELDDHKVLYIPKGFGNSFQALEDSVYIYMFSDEWSKDTKYTLVSYKDADIGIKWPLWEERIVSEKDEGHLPMRQVFPNWQPNK